MPGQVYGHRNQRILTLIFVDMRLFERRTMLLRYAHTDGVESRQSKFVPVKSHKCTIKRR